MRVRTPARYYVNLHNRAYRDGALRGQLARAATHEGPGGTARPLRVSIAAP